MDPEAISIVVAESIRGTLAVRDTASVAVSSGPILLAVLSSMATLGLPWERVRFLMTDEVAGAPTDPRSRYRQVYDAFFRRIGFHPGRVLRFWSEGAPPEEVAGYYGGMTAELLDLPQGELPVLDLVLLELAPDGSVGAFTPGSASLGPGGGFARPVEVGGELRYTLTADAIRRARRIVVVGAGAVEASEVVAALRPVDGELVVLHIGETGPPGAASQT